jgi:flagellar assembly factor FliW
MLQLHTKYFGMVSCEPADLFQFPSGLPAFEEEKSFAPLDLPGTEPLLFLQSATRPDLCFLCFPVLVVDSAYQLSVLTEDLQSLDLPTTRQPYIGSEVLVLALLSVKENEAASANLMAPLVINLRNRRAVQAIRSDAAYSPEYPIPRLAGKGTC